MRLDQFPSQSSSGARRVKVKVYGYTVYTFQVTCCTQYTYYNHIQYIPLKSKCDTLQATYYIHYTHIPPKSKCDTLQATYYIHYTHIPHIPPKSKCATLQATDYTHYKRCKVCNLSLVMWRVWI